MRSFGSAAFHVPYELFSSCTVEGDETCAPALEISAKTTTIHGHFLMSPPMGFETEQTIRSRYAARLFKAKLQARAQYSNAAIAPWTVLSMVQWASVRETNSPGAEELLPEFISHDSVSSIHSTFTLVAKALNVRKAKVLPFG